jgi:hypothetical protein
MGKADSVIVYNTYHSRKSFVLAAEIRLIAVMAR